MVIGKFLKGLVSAEAGGEFTLEAIEKGYWESKACSPSDPHSALANTWLGRKRWGGMSPSKPENQSRAYRETGMFACLEEPDNARALGYYFMQLETPRVFNQTPKFVLDYERVLAPLLHKSQDELLALYNKRNPDKSIDDISLRAFLDCVVAKDSEISRLRVPRW
jgi:hypothetical protein